MLKFLKNKHKGQTAVVIGGGPSLKDTPLYSLARLYPTFGCNKIFMYPFCPDYYTLIDFDMFHDCSEVLAAREYDGFPFDPKEIFLPRGVPIPGSKQMNLAVEYSFSQDIEKQVTMGGTVTYAMLQIAFFMGFETVLMVGIDHAYPKAAQGGKPGSKFLAGGEDQDHFHPEYFKPGRVYNRPELEGTSRFYALADQVYRDNGRRIYNLTPGTKLETIEKQSLADWI